MYATSLEPVSANYAGTTTNLSCCPSYGFPPISLLIRTGGDTYNILCSNGSTIPYTFTKDNLSYITNISVSPLPECMTALSITIPEGIINSGSDSGVVNSSGSSYSNSVSLKVASISPKKNVKSVSRTKTIAVKFNEKIKIGTNWSKVYVKNLKTGKKVKISKTIKNNMLYIKTSKKSAYTWYQVYIPASAVKDSTGNKLAKSYTWKFKTGK